MSENDNDLKEPLNKNFREPKLRFKGFTESWSEYTFGAIFNIITDYVAAGSFADIKTNVCYLSEPDYAQLIRTTDLKSKFKNNDFIYVNKSSFEYLYRVNLDRESIVLPNVGNCGEVYFVEPNALPYNKNVLGPNAILVRSKGHDNYFLSLMLQSKKAQKELSTIVSSQGQPKFNKTDLKKIKIDICTSGVEEEKIKKLFCLVESLINCEGYKIDILKKYKEGLLNCLIQNGQKLGKLFDYVEIQDKTYLKSSDGENNGTYPFFVNSTDESFKYTNNYLYDGGYIILNTGGDAYIRYYEGRFSAMSDCLVLKPKSNNIGIYYFLKTMQNKMSVVGFQGTGLRHLDQNWLFNLSVRIPKTNEQVLSEIENKFINLIVIEEAKQVCLQQIKKYFLQSLFI